MSHQTPCSGSPLTNRLYISTLGPPQTRCDSCRHRFSPPGTSPLVQGDLLRCLLPHYGKVLRRDDRVRGGWGGVDSVISGLSKIRPTTR